MPGPPVKLLLVFRAQWSQRPLAPCLCGGSTPRSLWGSDDVMSGPRCVPTYRKGLLWAVGGVSERGVMDRADAEQALVFPKRRINLRLHSRDFADAFIQSGLQPLHFPHRRRCRPRRATAGSSGAVEVRASRSGTHQHSARSSRGSN